VADNGCGVEPGQLPLTVAFVPLTRDR